MGNKRSDMYSLLARLYKREVDDKLLESLASMKFPQGDSNDILRGYGLIASYLSKSDSHSQEELAVDFARTFLAAGIAKGEAAFPFESVYTSKKKIVMQEAWEEVRGIYAARDIGLLKSDGEFLEDHIGCELEYMAYLCEDDTEGQKQTGESVEKAQLDFLENHLIRWVDDFTADVEKFSSTDFYKGLALLTRGFTAADCQFVRESLAEDKLEGELSESYSLSRDSFNQILGQLSENYSIYAPKLFKTGADDQGETIKYARVNSLEEIVTDRQSDFSPKESYYPISQTMFYFTESEVIESTLSDDKGILVFARPCDINAMERLDNIFLKNGGQEDMYYARLREKVKILMIECRESFPDCFCVSLGTNKTENYDLAVRFEEGSLSVRVKDPEMKKYFHGRQTCDFTPEFVKENIKKVKIPQINDRETLKWASQHEFWDKFDSKCIGCGGCNTVCGTCSCFDTVDIIYREGSKEGERRRVWSGCMLEDFTQTAGGARARKTAGANMRFKVFHKFYDYKARFGGEKHMCVGCGRCSRRCPENIDFFQEVNELAELIERRGTDNE